MAYRLRHENCDLLLDMPNTTPYPQFTIPCIPFPPPTATHPPSSQRSLSSHPQVSHLSHLSSGPSYAYHLLPPPTASNLLHHSSYLSTNSTLLIFLSHSRRPNTPLPSNHPHDLPLPQPAPLLVHRHLPGPLLHRPTGILQTVLLDGVSAAYAA